MASTETRESILSDELLKRFHERAPVYDRENRFFQEDFDELREIGYLKMAVPKELGGLGMNLAEVCREQRRLAYSAHATALAVNMHLYWTGIAADLWNSGDKSLEFLLRDTVAGEVYAAGHSESGNDMSLIVSSTKAERVEGGYRFTGRKSFGSMTPVWTFLGIHGMTSGSDTEPPQIIHAFLPRDSKGVTIKETWDTIGMRATRSDDTLLENVFIPDEYIVRALPTGFGGADAFVSTLFAWFLISIGSIYYSIGRRALDLTLERVKEKKTLGLTRSLAHHPAVQHDVAEMVMELESILPFLESTANDWCAGVAHPDWVIKLLSVKYKATVGAWKVVDAAFELGGGFSAFRKNEMERLFRDARLGRLHPANAALSRDLVAKGVLGIDPDERPRWG